MSFGSTRCEPERNDRIQSIFNGSMQTAITEGQGKRKLMVEVCLSLLLLSKTEHFD
jgi:hypothetical protein